MSDRTRDSVGACENPEPESDGARSHDGDNVTDERDQGQSDEPEGEVHRNELSEETGYRGEEEGYSEHPEGCEGQAVPVHVGQEQSSTGPEWVCTGQNGAADSDVLVSTGIRDTVHTDGAESAIDVQDRPLVTEASDGCRHSEKEHVEVMCSDSILERPEACLDNVTDHAEGSMDENLQAIGSDETEDNVEGLYREGGLGDLSNSNSNTESLSQHQGNSFEEAGFNENVTVEAESTEDDIFADVSNNDIDVENIEENVMMQFSDAHVREAECAEADNGTKDWMQELGSDDSSESVARAAIEPFRIETVAPSEDVQVNSLSVESDGHPAECVAPGDNEALSESDPEENACDQNMCNDSVEADSSENFRLQEPADRSEDIEASDGDGSQNRLAEADSAEASEEADQEEIIDCVPHAGAKGSSQVPNCAGESVGQDGVFSNLDNALNNSITSAESIDQEAHASPETVDPPRGDICHTSGTPEAGSPGDEPEDSDVSRPDLQPNNIASDTDLYAPECDRAQTSANQPVQDTPGSDVSEVEVQENSESQASGDGTSDDASSAEDSDVSASLPPCQQGSFHMEDVDLRSDQLCSGISGSDLGEDFLRSADMLQSLTESKSCGSEKTEEEDFQTESSNCEDNGSSSHSTVVLAMSSSDASESETNMQQIQALQASAVAACVLQDSNLTHDCVPHSSRDSCSEHSNSNSSSIENLPCVIALTDNESESSIVNNKFESIQGSSGVSICHSVGDVTDDDLLTELDAELEANSACDASSTREDVDHCDENGLISESTELSEPINGLRAMPAVALCELSDDKLRQLLGEMQCQISKKDLTIRKLQNDKALQAEKLQYVVFERDTYLKQLEASKNKQQADDLYLPQIKELEYTISQQQNENRGLKDKLASHDAAAKRAVTSLQNELKLRVDQVTKMYDECRKEKDSMVMKYAQAEHKNIELQRATEKAEGRLKEILKEREIFLTKARQLKADYQRTCSELETTTAELAVATRELDKHKELVTSAEVRIKWAQNKMKAELESHKETKKELDKSNGKIKEAREETGQIRRDCQAIIKTYQESEEMKSSTLDQRLKKKETELMQEKQEKTDQGEVYHAVLKELETLKVQYKDNMEELKTYRDKVRAQESERLTNEETMTKYKDIIQNQKKENRDLQAKIDKLFYIQSDFDRAQDMIKSLDADIRDLKLANKELQAEIESCRKRESHLLELTKKLTSKNAQLQSENTNLNGKVLNLSSDNQKKAMEIQEFETKLTHKSDKLDEEIKARKDETEKLKENLQIQTKSSEDFERLVEEQRDEMKTLKRKHANNVKDLTRQLQQARRKLESIDAKGDNKESMSMGSRTSSNGSLNTPQGDVNGAHTNPTPKAPLESPPQEYPVIVEQVEIDRQVLIDRIVKLQKAHARKNEKIEFMEDHIKQLVVEVKKKKRIIQHYVLREEAGALSTENMDLNKIELSKRGGIMASVYSSHASDSHMSLELSLEINKKLQSVLEDTLLKNITLKENIDTLGEEIARLSQENRRLQLSIQGLS